jgi:hypothetical protein
MNLDQSVSTHLIYTTNLINETDQISILGKKHVIVSTEKIAKDLFSDRGSIYSDREVTPMVSTLVGGGMTFVLLPFGGMVSLHKPSYQVLTL